MNSLQQAAPLPYLTDLGARIQRHPLEALGIGFLTGFVVGGGQQSHIGQGLIGFAAAWQSGKSRRRPCRRH